MPQLDLNQRVKELERVTDRLRAETVELRKRIATTWGLAADCMKYPPGNITMTDDAWIGLGVGAGRVVFDSTPTPDTVSVEDADFYVGSGNLFLSSASYKIYVSGNDLYFQDVTGGPYTLNDLYGGGGGGDHNMLSATHLDSTTQAVSRGSIIYGNATPAWDELAHPGGAGYALTTDATDVAWSQTPTWTGTHLWAGTAGITFYDASLKIYSSTDGQLDIDADTEVEITATTIDLTGNVDVSNGLDVTGNITVTGTVDGVDVAAHASRHLPSGGDPITTAVAGSISPDDIAAEGSAESLAKSDHTHGIVCAAPGTNLSVSTTNQEGSASDFARSDHSHAITTSSAPGAAVSILASDVSGYLTLTKIITPEIGSASNVTIAPTGDIIFNPTGDDILPENNYDLNLGSLSKKYLTLHAAELWVETLVAQDTMATIGGRILIGPTTILTSDLASGSTTMYVKHNNLASGDVVVMEANGAVEWIRVDSAPGGSGPYSYTIARNLDGSGANDWYAGDAVFNTGTTGDGFMDLYSLAGVIAGSTAGPTIVGNVRNSNTYDDYDEHWAIGNLDGLYGYSTTTYGVAFGEYAVGQNHITIESTNGIRFFEGTSTVIAQWNGATITLGDTGNEHIVIDTSGVSLKDSGTIYGVFASTTTIGLTSGEHVSLSPTALQLKYSTIVRGEWQTDGDIFIGSDISAAGSTYLAIFATGQTYNSESVAAGDMLIGDNTASKANIYWDYSAGQLLFRGGTTTTVYIDTSGSLTAGVGEVMLDADGITLNLPTAYADKNNIKWCDDHDEVRVALKAYDLVAGDTIFGSLEVNGKSTYYTDHAWLNIVTYGAASRTGTIHLAAQGNDGSGIAELTLECDATGAAEITATAYNIWLGGTYAELELLETTLPQLRLTHTFNSVYTDFTTDGSGHLKIAPTGYWVGIGKDPDTLFHLYREGAAELRIQNVHNTELNRLTFYKANAGPALVDAWESIGWIEGYAYDGNNYELACQIKFGVADTPADEDMPGSMDFLTAPPSSGGTVHSRLNLTETLARFNYAMQDYDLQVRGTTIQDLLRVDAGSERIGIGVGGPQGMCHIDQTSTTAAIPVLYLDQADISEEMIEFNTTIGIGNAIEAVGGKTLTVTHFIKVMLPGSLTRYIPVGTIA